jgi:hypothetical protein
MIEMEPNPRIPPDQHRSRAARYRALAREVTTTRAREHLLGMARQSDALAKGGEDPPAVAGPRR